MGDFLPAVSLGTGRTARQIHVGGGTACAILDDYSLKCWGSNDYGQLGLEHNANLGDGANEMGNNLATVNLGTGRTAKRVAVGSEHTCAILDDNTVKCWGYNDFGALGLGDQITRGDWTATMGDNLPTVSLGTGRTATMLVTGAEHTCVVLDNGTAKCWGVGNSGQLGTGSTLNVGDGPNQMGDNLSPLNLGTGRSVLQFGDRGPLKPKGQTFVRWF